jgi:hypothetical protein
MIYAFITLLVIFPPILVPLLFWFGLKKKESKVYKPMRYWRYVVAALIVLVAAMKLSKGGNPAELLGAMGAYVLMIYLLCKKWVKSEATEGVSAADDQK